MTIGQRLKQARLEAGLSQRQLCGDTITRNMLSLIENGSARPSMDTLTYLAGRLGKSVSYFLEENAVLSANQSVMEAARQAFAEKRYGAALAAMQASLCPESAGGGCPGWGADTLFRYVVAGAPAGETAAGIGRKHLRG